MTCIEFGPRAERRHSPWSVLLHHSLETTKEPRRKIPCFELSTSSQNYFTFCDDPRSSGMPSPLPLLEPGKAVRITATPLTSASFAEFGSVISSPLSPEVNILPDLPKHPQSQPPPVVANQSTALKYAPISLFTDSYHDAPSRKPSKPLLSLFSSFPRPLDANGAFTVDILERHPFTSQTFTPLGFSYSDSSALFLVIVAPTRSGSSAADVLSPPDLKTVKAFIGRAGQAVTYASGTWHSPMVVVGRRRVDFVVTQFVNGVKEEDYQEVQIRGGITVQGTSQRVAMSKL